LGKLLVGTSGNTTSPVKMLRMGQSAAKPLNPFGAGGRFRD